MIKRKWKPVSQWIMRKQSHCITSRQGNLLFAAPPSRLGRTRGQRRGNALLRSFLLQTPSFKNHVDWYWLCTGVVEDRILDNPGILGAAALARIDDERFLLQGHSCQSARHDPDAIRAGENEGPQIDMTRRDAGIEKSRGCGERERWLSDEIIRIAGEFRRENFAFGL